MAVITLSGFGIQASAEDKANPTATLILAEGQKIVFELYPEYAPQSVAQFVRLVNEGRFNGSRFWRIEKDLLVQFGQGDPEIPMELNYGIKGEFRENGVDNPLNFIAGTFGFGRLTPNDAGGAIFFTVKDVPSFDGKYAAFARVIEGLDYAKAMSQEPSTPISDEITFIHTANDPVVISKVIIEDNSYEFEPVAEMTLPSPEAVAAAMGEVERVGDKAYGE